MTNASKIAPRPADASSGCAVTARTDVHSGGTAVPRLLRAMSLLVMLGSKIGRRCDAAIPVRPQPCAPLLIEALPTADFLWRSRFRVHRAGMDSSPDNTSAICANSDHEAPAAGAGPGRDPLVGPSLRQCS